MKNIITQQAKDKIDALCHEYNITNYQIRPDGLIDVDGSVNLSNKGLTRIPLRFNKVSEFFFCDTNKITSLRGCPKEVGASFSCSNNKLKSLQYGPVKVEITYYCKDNQLTSLEFCPIVVNDLYCDNNKLSTLIGSPRIVKNILNCPYNELLTSLEGCPDEVGMINCDNCNLSTLEYLPKKMGDGILIDNNNFPESFMEMHNQLNTEQSVIFSKYLSYYEIWMDGIYQEDNMQILCDDITNGML
jgi:hypothetical protein